MSYTHVYRKKDLVYHCAIGSKCMRYKVTVAKKTVSTSLCPHEHIATVLTHKNELPADSLSEPVVQAPSKFNKSEWMKNTSAFIYFNKKLDLSKSRKKQIEKRIMMINSSGWPKVYEPSEDCCPHCSILLESPKQHPGKLREYLFTSFYFLFKSFYFLWFLWG